MEILAPAGSFEQALVSIENGCNALYGGLKKWSARSRAINLSDEEYCKLIDICKEKNIQFYLTLNTLMSDQELEDIKNFFSRKDIPRPQGILVGDIGLMKMLQETFPDITLHASTQFGAYSIRDVLYFEALGLSRVVLARELTLREIEYIKLNTSAELEIFVYGNQCVIFSGNCLWGGLTHSGSGHKGCCIGTCNDIFQSNTGRMGNFLWANNIGLFKWTKKLYDIGIDSIKIEGRVRPCSEVKEVVSKFNRSLHGEIIENDYNYDGFIGGQLPPKGIFNDFNPENRYRNIEGMVFSKDDYLHTVKDGIQSFVYGDEAKTNEYVFTFFKSEWTRNHINIRVRFGFDIIDDRVILNSVEYVRVNGTKMLFMLNDENEQGEKSVLSLEHVYRVMKEQLKVNVYDCKAKIPALTNVEIDMIKFYSVLEKINHDTDSIVCREPDTYDNTPANAIYDLLFVCNASDICHYVSRGYKNFIVKIKTIKELEKCLQMEDAIEEIRIFYQLPYLDFNNKMEIVCKMLRGRNIVITRISQLDLKEKYEFGELYGDYMLNVWNAKSAKWLKNRGINALIAHPELSLKRIEQISTQSGVEMIIIAASKIPFGYTRACFRDLKLCNGTCSDNITELHNTYKDKDLEVVCDNEFGYRTIFDREIFVSKKGSIGHRRLYGLFGLSNEAKENVLLGKRNEYIGKEIIYTEGFYEI